MAAGTWNAWKRAKLEIGQGRIDLSTRELRITLHSVGASANLGANVDITTLASVGSELAATRGYAANGKTISAGAWALSGTDAVYSGSGVFWSANGGNLGSGTVKYAVIHASEAGGTRFPMFYVTLTSTPVLVANGSRVTINNGGAIYFKLT